MSAISSIAGFWMEGALRTLDAFTTGFGQASNDPPTSTPYRVIYEGGKVRLRHYEAAGAAHHTPVLLIYSLIKRPFILDLMQGRSVVENLTRQGFDFYMIAWVPPVAADKYRGFHEYVDEDIANSVRAVQLHRGVEKVSIIGYCFGGLLALLYAALHPQNVKNLVPLTLPLDMSPTRPADRLHVADALRNRRQDAGRYLRQRPAVDDLLVLQHARADSSSDRQVRRRAS